MMRVETESRGPRRKPAGARFREAVAFAAVTERHVTEYLANWYLFLWQALGDAIEEVGGLPGSPSSRRPTRRPSSSGPTTGW